MASTVEQSARGPGGLTMLGVGATGPDGSDAGPDVPQNGVAMPARLGASAADRDALAILLSVPGLGPLTLGRLVGVVGSPSMILEVVRRPRAIHDLVAASRTFDGSGRAMPESVATALVAAEANGPAILREVRLLGCRGPLLGAIHDTLDERPLGVVVADPIPGVARRQIALELFVLGCRCRVAAQVVAKQHVDALPVAADRAHVDLVVA